MRFRWWICLHLNYREHSRAAAACANTSSNKLTEPAVIKAHLIFIMKRQPGLTPPSTLSRSFEADSIDTIYKQSSKWHANVRRLPFKRTKMLNWQAEASRSLVPALVSRTSSAEKNRNSKKKNKGISSPHNAVMCWKNHWSKCSCGYSFHMYHPLRH